MKPAFAFAVCCLLMLSPALIAWGHSTEFDPVSQDPPVLEREFPGSLERVAISSGGEKLIGRMFVAQGKGPHPTVLIARGFPDYPGNLDLAMVLQRAGYNVPSFNYRGFWGSGGHVHVNERLPRCRRGDCIHSCGGHDKEKEAA